MNKTISRTRRTLFLAATILGLAASQTQAADLGCRLLPGSYLTTITDIEGVFASRGVVTFIPGGVLIVADSRQGGQTGVYDPFSVGQGAWTCAKNQKGKIAFHAISITFTTPPGSAGSQIGHVDYAGVVDTTSGEIEGNLSLRLSDTQDLEGQDPISNPGEVLEKFDFSGKRIRLP